MTAAVWTSESGLHRLADRLLNKATFNAPISFFINSKLFLHSIIRFYFRSPSLARASRKRMPTLIHCGAAPDVEDPYHHDIALERYAGWLHRAIARHPCMAPANRAEDGKTDSDEWKREVV
jgi:hypothetical protein